MENTWKVGFNDANKRLDVFLTEKIPHASRSAIAKELKRGGGTINGKPASVHAFLKEGDVVIFKPITAEKVRKSASPKVRSANYKPRNAEDLEARNAKLGDKMESVVRKSESPNGSRITDHGSRPIPKIIKETKDWLVIDKPTGLLVHPTIAEETDTLVDWLVEHDPKIGKIGEDPSRPGIMHRLDREVSGLMVVAKTQDAFDSLKKQFAEHTTTKNYLALAHGSLPKDEGEIKFKIARSKQGGRMAARPEGDEQGKAAWTHYKVLKRFKNATLVELEIMSGRTHQIRAHLFALGCPIVGDELYTRKDIKPIKTDRLMLQAVKLEFDDPATAERQTFSLPADPAFEKVTSKLP